MRRRQPSVSRKPESAVVVPEYADQLFALTSAPPQISHVERRSSAAAGCVMSRRIPPSPSAPPRHAPFELQLRRPTLVLATLRQKPELRFLNDVNQKFTISSSREFAPTATIEFEVRRESVLVEVF